MMARTYRVISALLSYPTVRLQRAVPELVTVLNAERLISSDRVSELLNDLIGSDIYELEERYVDLFDRGRSVSMHLFEHVHGESRDRGQAMADLGALYAEHGLDMQPGELPDFLPLFLEFLSLLPQDEARKLLAEPAAILRAIGERLTRRHTGYASVVNALADLAEAPAQGASAIPDEDPNDLAALDAAWEEAAIGFGPGEALDGCSTDRLRTRLRAASRDAAAA